MQENDEVKKTEIIKKKIGTGLPGPGRPQGSKNRIDEMLKSFMSDCFEIWDEIEGKKKLISYLKKYPRFIPKFAAMLQGFAPKTFLAEIGIEARPTTVMPSLTLVGGKELRFEVGSEPIRQIEGEISDRPEVEP